LLPSQAAGGIWKRLFQLDLYPLTAIEPRPRKMARHHTDAQSGAQTLCGRGPVRHHHSPLVVQQPGDPLGQQTGCIFPHQRRPAAQEIVTQRATPARQRVMSGHDAAPVEHPHIAKGKAPAYRYGLSRTDSQLYAPIGQRIPDAIKYLLRHQQLYI